MTCKTTREWLLNAERPAAATPEIAEHLSACAGCRKLQSDLVKLESRWRNTPLPEQAESSKQAFLAKLANPATPARTPSPPSRRWRVPAWSIAAVLFVGLGISALVFWPTQQVQANPDVLDQLIEWNLELSEAPSPADRKRIYRDRMEALKKALKQAKLNQQEQELGNSLLANGAWMSDNEDSVEELNRFHQMADSLLDRVHVAGVDPGTSDRFARQFRIINERGIDKNIQRIKFQKLNDPERRMKFHKLLKEDADRAEKLIKMVEQAPAITTRELKQALELNRKRHKQRKS